MTALVLVALGVALWCLVPLPVAVVVGRAFRAGETDDEFAGTVRDYDAVGM
ncbi:hypothetical protein GCM10023350_26020 [Nocardioides endophyticus]|uniref:Uncharacterized protein n=1 Tax=Nocardioides endophyticus TaxID=1353775 RepID=A0ABP8YWX0_9ACTN